MFDAVQETIDRLAASLRRSASLVYADLTLVASSRHHDDVDPAQITLLTTRHAQDAIGHSTLSAASAVVINADADRGIHFPRMVLTLRSPAETFGYLIITLSTPLTPLEYLSMLEAADVLRHLMENASRSIEDVNLEVEAEMMALLTDEETNRAMAADELLGLGMFPHSNYLVSLCVEVDLEWGPWDGPPVREVLTRLVSRAITTPRIDSYAFVPTAPATFILIGFQRPPAREALDSIVSGLAAELTRARSGEALPGRVGVGGTVHALADAWQSYDQAVVATKVARALRSPYSYWIDSPVEASLAAMFGPIVPEHLRTDSIHRLESAPTEVSELLVAYFDEAGSATAIAARFGVHRATIYQRLDRVAKLIGLDLTKSDDRLVIHAWLAKRRFID
ncbi:MULTISPECIES: PucR family transcriptional regulator [unclassified Microbacterium]|uniref:PucR family transcriptional regulator n=1 Tax=unclassified Microbacterium TaxID=2609290 RepID=UPI000492F315|nr:MULTISPECIES: PucR family transcriptional regulator [unclassified Microbacterium]